jgi:predicted lipoprotein
MINKSLRVLYIFCVLTMVFISWSCTVVDNDEESKDKDTLDIYFVDDKFKADEYVKGIWDSKVIPYVKSNAIDLSQLLAIYTTDQEEAGKNHGYREKAEGSPWNFKVKGTGKIIKAKTTSKAATMDIDLAPGDGKKDAIIQIGPVIKGTAIRDTLDFITFGMFTNQIEFAQLSNALNKKAYDTVLSQFDRNTIIGKTIYFEGAFTQVPYSNKILITPVKLEIK